MAQINLVTGYTGEAHIKSEDDALLNRFLLGQSSSVIALNSTFNDTNCTITCSAIVNGRLAKTDSTVTLSFTKPSSGYYRYDGIYIVYKKATNGIESAQLVYCEGTQSTNQSTAITNEGTPEPGTPIPADFTYIQLYEIEWNTSQQKNVIKNSAYDVPQEKTVNIKSGTTTVGTATQVTIPLIGGLYLVCGSGSISKSMTSGTNYNYTISTGDSGNFVSGGVQIYAYTGGENTQTLATVTISNIVVGLKVGTNTSSAVINYWYIKK